MQLITPHENQKKIIQGKKRFNYLKCGRRFGKTILINQLVGRAFINRDKYGNTVIPFKVGLWMPTYKDLSKVWQKLKSDFHDGILKKDESLKQIKTITGGEIDLWSMENPDSGRGMDYDRAIIDEFAKAGKNKQAWQKTIRPTLTDRKGDAWLLSTPKGKHNYFYTIALDHLNDVDWAFWKFTSYDNPYLDPEEIDSAKNQLDKISFQQEYLAEDVDANEKPFLYSFDEKQHTATGLKINNDLPLWLSFDFNVMPQTCSIAQRIDEDTLHIIELLRLDNSSIYNMCDHIRVKYKNYYTVTGDASGNNRQGVTNQTYWQVIKKELRLSDRQIKVRTKNLDHRTSQIICNSVLTHKDIKIDTSLRELIDDITYASTDEHGKIIKTPDRGLHFFDNFRYLLDANFPNIINIK
jgi:hypothetical protein